MHITHEQTFVLTCAEFWFKLYYVMTQEAFVVFLSKKSGEFKIACNQVDLISLVSSQFRSYLRKKYNLQHVV